jgi:hypothetical protein
MSFLQPGPLTLTTPAEMLPYGWTTTDLWCAPLVTGLYALLTHAQPFWAEAHGALASFLNFSPADLSPEKSPGVQPLDAETARAACAAVLGVLFVTRAVKNYGGEYARSWQAKRNVRVVSKHGTSVSRSLPRVHRSDTLLCLYRKESVGRFRRQDQNPVTTFLVNVKRTIRPWAAAAWLTPFVLRASLWTAVYMSIIELRPHLP